MIIPIISRVLDVDALPLRVRVPAGVGGLAKDSDVLIDQILAWDNELFARELGVLPDAIEIRAALLDFVDL